MEETPLCVPETVGVTSEFPRALTSGPWLTIHLDIEKVKVFNKAGDVLIGRNVQMCFQSSKPSLGVMDRVWRTGLVAWKHHEATYLQINLVGFTVALTCDFS